MYPNILVSIFILLMAVEIIGHMLRREWLVKTAAVGMVLLVAAALIVWLLLGLSPVPVWFTKFVSRILRSIPGQ